MATSSSVAPFERYECVHDGTEERARHAVHERQMDWFIETFGRADHADAVTLDSWVADLQSRAQRVARFATKVVAHRDDLGFDVDEQVTFGELDAALHLVYDYFNKGSELLRNSTTLLPTVSRPTDRSRFEPESSRRRLARVRES
jgi:hypothetical protein